MTESAHRSYLRGYLGNCNLAMRTDVNPKDLVAKRAFGRCVCIREIFKLDRIRCVAATTIDGCYDSHALARVFRFPISFGHNQTTVKEKPSILFRTDFSGVSGVVQTENRVAYGKQHRVGR